MKNWLKNWRIPCHRHIETKRLHMILKAPSLHWLINHQSKLNPDNKVNLYKIVLKLVCTYEHQLRGKDSKSSIDFIRRAQSKIPRIITGAPFHIRNENIHRELMNPLVKGEFRRNRERYIYEKIVKSSSSDI